MKKIKKLLGLTEEAPKPGHWLEGLRSAGTTNVPATTGEVNTSAVERMMNTPIDRRTFMEKAGQAAQAASVANRMGGALENILPQAVEAAPVGMSATEYLQSFAGSLSPRKIGVLAEEYDMFPEDLISYGRTPILEDFKATNPADKKTTADEMIDHIMSKLGSAEGRFNLSADQQLRQAELAEEADELFNVLSSIGFKGKRHKELPDLFDYFNTMVDPPSFKTQGERDEYFRKMDELGSIDQRAAPEVLPKGEKWPAEVKEPDARVDALRKKLGPDFYSGGGRELEHEANMARYRHLQTFAKKP